MLKMLIQRPIAVTMALISIVVLGLVSINLLPVSLIPDVDIPYITVQISDSKLSARQLEEGVVKPIRQQLMQIDGVEDISCTSKDGNATIRLSFGYDSNIDYLFIEVNERVDRVMPYLPDIQRPRVVKASATDIPAFYIDITLKEGSKDSFSQLSAFTNKVINRRIEQLPQVAMADISGYEMPQITVLPNREKLHSLGISLAEFENYVKSANVRLGSLTIRDGEYSYDVKFESLAAGQESIKNILINKNGKLLKISDIAQVEYKSAKRTGYVFSNGLPALSIAVIKQKDAKMSELRRSIDGLMKEFESDYGSIDFKITRNQTQLLDYSINSLFINILLAILLSSFIILLFFRELKTSALVIVVIPTSLIFSLLLFYLFGLYLNTLSLSGLLLGVGMMVDNTIILLDNITERWKRSSNLYLSVIEGTKEVRGAMLSSLLTTCAVFIPIVFVSGIAGALFSDQAIAVTITLITSYIITITVVPVFYYWWFKKQGTYKDSHFLKSLDFTPSMLSWGNRVMQRCIDKSRAILAILAISIVGSALFFSLLRKERLPHITYSEAIVNIDWNSQISVEENRNRVVAIEKLIEEDALQVTSLVGVQQYVLGHSPDLSANQASIYIKCSNQKILNSVKERIEQFIYTNHIGAVCQFRESGNILDVAFGERQALITAKLSSAASSLTDIPKLNNALAAIRSFAEVSDLRLKKDVVYIADPVAMALHNVSYSQLIYTLRSVLKGNTVFEIVQGEQVLPVVVGDEEKNLSDIISGATISVNNLAIPLNSLLKQTYKQDLQTITSGADGEYYPVEISVSHSEAKSVMNRVEDAIKQVGDFSVSFSGAWFSNRVIAREMGFAFFIALVMLYIILAAQFESLLQPVIILSEIVIDVFAVLVVMWVIGVSINVISLIGLVVVCGIVINDSILKIDTINRLRKSGIELRQAVMEAADRRMKSIVMTSLTTILAVLPFLKRGSIGDDLQFPMSVVIIVGMAVGTFISLFIVPALYYLIYKKKAGSKNE